MLPQTFSRSMACVCSGILLCTSGGLLAFFWPTIFKHIVATSLKLSPGGMSYEIWKDTPVPMYIEFFFFNWTNPEELLEEGKKPNLQELGPYRFKELKVKKDIVWNDNNDTISFTQERQWFYDEENSRGSLSDMVTTLNVVALTSAYVSRHWSLFLVLPLSQVLKGQSIAITHNVSELLFEGYNDALIGMGKMGSVFAKDLEVPYDKFGWFYTRNGSKHFDGMFNMATGADDISKIGLATQWNYNNFTKYYPGTCGKVNGSAGELFAPERTKGESVGIFSPDLCRSIYFDYTDEMTVEGITGYRYTGGRTVVDNGTLDAGNTCFCGGDCVPAGVLNVSTCRFGAPAFVSYPHFYLADPYYLNQVDGMKPNASKHMFSITLEPTTGIPLDVTARFQINILLQPHQTIALLRDVPKIFFPVMWFQQHASVTPELASSLKQLLWLPTLGVIGAIIIVLTGVCLFALVLLARWQRRRVLSTPNKQTERIVKYSDVVSPLMMRTYDPSHADSVYFDAATEKTAQSPKHVIIRKQPT